MDALSGGTARPKPSRSTQGQPGGTPAGPGSSKKAPAAEEEPFILPEKKAAGLKAAGKPGPGAQPLIKIESDAGAVARPAANVDPFAFYASYYHSRDKDRIDPGKLRQTLVSLNRLRKPREVHAAILGYLKNLRFHRVAAEPWMYEALAMALEMNKGTDADVQKSLDFAADLAQGTHNPNHLVSVADLLYRKGYLKRVGALLDEAMPKVPHRYDPVLISINLAQKTKDPVRMADSIDRLLSLGWPGRDEYFRIEAGNQIDQLAKELRAADRGAEADVLQKKLEESMSRDLFVRLTWDGSADFDLSVDEPLGVTANYAMPRTVSGGAMIKNGYGTHPEEMYVCPRAFSGKYTIRVSNIWADPKQPVTRLTLEVITHEGTSTEKKESRNLKPSAENPPTLVTLTDGRRKRVLPFVDPSASVMEAAIKDAKGALKAKQQPGAKGGEVRKAPAGNAAGMANTKP
jgi:hypothetical protein